MQSIQLAYGTYLLFGEAGIYDEDNTINGERGLSYVGGHHNLNSSKIN